MLTIRTIGQHDYTVREDGQPIGRIRYARERTPGIWLWNVTVNIPGPPFGSATSLDEAKAQFKKVRLAFKEMHGPDKLAKVLCRDEPAEDDLAKLRPQPPEVGCAAPILDPDQASGSRPARNPSGMAGRHHEARYLIHSGSGFCGSSSRRSLCCRDPDKLSTLL
jgi:hypothetical protein